MYSLLMALQLALTCVVTPYYKIRCCRFFYALCVFYVAFCLRLFTIVYVPFVLLVLRY